MVLAASGPREAGPPLVQNLASLWMHTKLTYMREKASSAIKSFQWCISESLERF